MKLYFGVVEASRILGVKPHTLRYWETKVSALRPHRRKSRRFYSVEDLKVALILKYLIKEMGFSLHGAAKKIEREGVETLFLTSWERFSGDMRKDLEEILQDIIEVKDILKVPPTQALLRKKGR